MNLLSMWALHYVSASVFVVVLQLKLVWTALFWRLLLKRQLTTLHYVAMLGIGAGVACVSVKEDAFDVKEGATLPIVALVVETILSGFATCWTEMTFGKALETMWIRNAQFAVISIVLYVVQSERNECVLTPTPVALGIGAAGGILVALVLLYAGAIEKTVATNAATACTFIADALLFGASMNLRRLLACLCVLVDCYIFGMLPTP